MALGQLFGRGSLRGIDHGKIKVSIPIAIIQLDGLAALLLGRFLQALAGGGNSEVVTGFGIGGVESDGATENLNRIVIFFLLNQSDSQDGVGEGVVRGHPDGFAQGFLRLGILLLLKAHHTQVR